MEAQRQLRGGIDLGGTKIEAIVVDDADEVLGQSREPTPTEGGPPEVAAQMAEALKGAASRAGVEPASLVGVGVGSPGDVDEATGTVANARNLPNWDAAYELGPQLSARLGPPVFVGNDVQVATQAEFDLGAGKPYDSVLGVFWGTGVGGGLILDRRPWLGRGGAGEIGHMVVRRNGAHCPCGRRGCMEAYAGRAAMEARARREVDSGAKTDLFKLMKQRGRARLTSSVWEQAYRRDDPLAIELIDRAVKALGAGIASAVNLLDIEAVIIGGGLGVRFGQPMAERIATEMHPHLFNDARPPAVRVAGLGDAGGAIGAAMLVRPAVGRPAPARA
ncbi:MAG TPA: ROK family protein [Solirubrobacteraceae bacterium]|jgi:glucokinase|nr:ROK family protein [Solirubrobacteraceae bacterium]